MLLLYQVQFKGLHRKVLAVLRACERRGKGEGGREEGEERRERERKGEGGRGEGGEGGMERKKEGGEGGRGRRREEMRGRVERWTKWCHG